MISAPHEFSSYLLKIACTDVLLLIVTVQVGTVPAHAPLQPAKVVLEGGVAVKVITVPALNFAEQVLPQLSA